MPISITQAELSAHLRSLLSSADRPVVLALDGRCGSGKTTLAAALARQFPASNTLHMDDFYLPLSQRLPEWEQTPCANMDLERLLHQTLQPAFAGQPVPYNAYSCRQGCFLPQQTLPSQPLVLLEGSYSHHPMLRSFETLRVFVTCSPEEQARRLQKREGSRYAAFSSRWIPLEEAYFAQYQLPSISDFVVDTT